MRSCSTQTAAKELQREVEAAVAVGKRWELRDADRPPFVEEVLEAFVRESVRVLAPGTARLHARWLEIFKRFLATKFPRGTEPAVLTRASLGEYYAWLAEDGRHGRSRKPITQKRLTKIVEQFWAWAHEEDEIGQHFPRPRKLKYPSIASTPTVAPTWAEMDKAIENARGWARQLMIVLRFTGLRVDQVMRLLWSDFDLDQRVLPVRGELGKTESEKRGRIVPISPHLATELAGWGRRAKASKQRRPRVWKPRADHAKLREAVALAIELADDIMGERHDFLISMGEPSPNDAARLVGDLVPLVSAVFRPIPLSDGTISAQPGRNLGCG